MMKICVQCQLVGGILGHFMCCSRHITLVTLQVNWRQGPLGPRSRDLIALPLLAAHTILLFFKSVQVASEKLVASKFYMEPKSR